MERISNSEKHLARLIIVWQITTCVLLSFGCNTKDSKRPFFKNGQEIAYWDLHNSDLKPTSYGYAFHQSGRLEYFVRWRDKPSERVEMGLDDVFIVNQDWAWNGDTLLLQGFRRLLWKVKVDSFILLNPIRNDLEWMIYSKDQETRVLERK